MAHPQGRPFNPGRGQALFFLSNSLSFHRTLSFGGHHLVHLMPRRGTSTVGTLRINAAAMATQSAPHKDLRPGRTTRGLSSFHSPETAPPTIHPALAHPGRNRIPIPDPYSAIPPIQEKPTRDGGKLPQKPRKEDSIGANKANKLPRSHVRSFLE